VVFGGRTAGNPQRPGDGPGMLPMRPPGPRADSPDQGDLEGERKRLTVGPGISLSGRITDCDRLVVEGEVRVVLQRVRAVTITGTGRFTEGRAEVEEADIGGLYEGELTVRGRLLIRRTGRVTGTVRYGELEIERGGDLSGSVERLAASAGPALVALDASAEAPQAPRSLSATLRAVDPSRAASSGGDGSGEEPPPRAA
jgi:cytoskeletal protein CcmA (bactofilin family)